MFMVGTDHSYLPHINTRDASATFLKSNFIELLVE